MAEELIFMIKEADDGGYIAEGLGYSIYTEADDIVSLRQNIKEAINCHFDDKANIPKIIRLHYVKDEILTNV